MSKEAIKLAIEALQYPLNTSHEGFNVDMAELLAHRAIKALEAALAKQEQDEPVAYINIEKRRLEWAHDYMSWDTPTVVNLPRIPLYTTPQPKQEQGEPVAWKLMPKNATDAMLKAMDECSTEGYDERLYAGHASSVYTAAWDALDTTPQQRKPLTDEQIFEVARDHYNPNQRAEISFARAIEAAHGIKE